MDLCTSLYCIEAHVEERDGVWDESWTHVAHGGWLQEIAGCQIVCVGSYIPVPACLLLFIVFPIPNLGWLSG